MTIPYGETSFTELKAIFKDKIELLDTESTGAFMLEGMSLLADLRAAFLECRKYGCPIYVMLHVDDELKTEHELPADAALIVMQSLGSICFGITADSVETLVEGIRRIKPYSQIPLAVRPKSGSLTDEEIVALLEAGTDVFFGLDNDSHTRLQNIVSNVGWTPPDIDYIDSLMLANERSAFFLEHDTTEISDPIECNAGMGEDLVAACDNSGVDVLKIQINNPDDVLDFADNAHMATLPVMFSGDDEIAMKLAVMLYQGRALIDSTSLIDIDELKKAAQKYGAVIY
jgi:5-methyltetrahydrofolate--homocysteine methyltransferase